MGDRRGGIATRSIDETLGNVAGARLLSAASAALGGGGVLNAVADLPLVPHALDGTATALAMTAGGAALYQGRKLRDRLLRTTSQFSSHELTITDGGSTRTAMRTQWLKLPRRTTPRFEDRIAMTGVAPDDIVDQLREQSAEDPFWIWHLDVQGNWVHRRVQARSCRTPGPVVPLRMAITATGVDPSTPVRITGRPTKHGGSPLDLTLRVDDSVDAVGAHELRYPNWESGFDTDRVEPTERLLHVRDGFRELVITVGAPTFRQPDPGAELRLLTA